jgi:hypothetical protein
VANDRERQPLDQSPHVYPNVAHARASSASFATMSSNRISKPQSKSCPKASLASKQVLQSRSVENSGPQHCQHRNGKHNSRLGDLSMTVREAPAKLLIDCF